MKKVLSWFWFYGFGFLFGMAPSMCVVEFFIWLDDIGWMKSQGWLVTLVVCAYLVSGQQAARSELRNTRPMLPAAFAGMLLGLRVYMPDSDASFDAFIGKLVAFGLIYPLIYPLICPLLKGLGLTVQKSEIVAQRSLSGILSGILSI